MHIHIKFVLGKHKKFLQWCFLKIGLAASQTAISIILKNVKGVTFINLIKIL